MKKWQSFHFNQPIKSFQQSLSPRKVIALRGTFLRNCLAISENVRNFAGEKERNVL
jgi:hypothetical protein